MKKLDTPHQIFTYEQAEKIVDEMNDEIDDWVYKVIKNSTTKTAVIRIYDEDGEVVGLL